MQYYLYYNYQPFFIILKSRHYEEKIAKIV